MLKFVTRCKKSFPKAKNWWYKNYNYHNIGGSIQYESQSGDQGHLS